ncbi:electron transport complex subunit RsxB [Roseateles paludis]|uniref:Electron transport complex subunit RsxB n=1 Tax=Roseateles paludis TaxID=3145238 RepID=A0ABV0G3K9_9BURK
MKAQADQIDDALPQTQCTRCGYVDCRNYAEAMVGGEAGINQCPPGGAEGIARLAALTGQAVIPLSPEHGQETPRGLAVIDEAWCIGCTLCIKACPVDAIVGAPKLMHWVVNAQCTGCELCVPACPVDCIQMRPETTTTGWAAWSPAQARQAQERYRFRAHRRHREAEENEARLAAKARAKLADLPAHTKGAEGAELERKRAVIEAALARARAKRGA